MPRSFLVKQHEKPQESERATGMPREAEKDSIPSLPPPLLKVSPRTSSQRAWVPMDDRPVPKLVKIESTSTKPLNSAFEYQTNSIKQQVKKDLHDTFSSIRDSQMRCQLSMVELSPKEVWMCQSTEATKPRHPSFVDDIRRGSYTNAGYFREYFDAQCFAREEERYLHRPHHVDMAKKQIFPPFYPGSVSNGGYCLASSPMFASESGIYPSSIYGNMSFLGSKANDHSSPSRCYEPEYQTNLPVSDRERATAENVIEHVTKDEEKLFPDGIQVKQDNQSSIPESSSNNDQGKPLMEGNQSGASLNTLNAMVTKEAPSSAETSTPKAQSTAKKYRYTCDVCGKSFSRSNTLTTHKRIHTGDKPFHCEQCGRAFRQPGNLTRHRLTHTAVKPYVCPQCNKAFNRASNLHTHMRTHTNYKPFVCDFCGKGFHQKIDMKIHRYTHTGEKPHKCNKCGRGFKQLTHLTYHMRTHSDERLYKCDYCGKGFNQKGNLQAHIYGHTGERPFKCDICDKGFTLASTLNTHKRTHAMKKPFECQFCGKAFYQKNALKTHYIASHPFANGVSLL